MNISSSNSCAKQFGTILAWIIASFCCGLATSMGASLGGLKSGPQGLGILLFFFYGCLGGAILIPVISVILSSRGKSDSSFLSAAMMAPIIVLLLGAVSMPILKAVGGISWKSRQEFSEKSKQKYDELYNQIKDNPEIALEESWGKGDYEHAMVFEVSWADENIPYTVDQLRRIHESDPRIVNVFFHPACTPEFLAFHFDSSYKGDSIINDRKLAAIVSNPKTPRDLLLKVARYESYSYGAVRQAKRTLKNLKEQQAQQDAAPDGE